MAELLAWLEASGLGRLMRGTGVWTYGCVNLAHILGVASLWGSIVVLDLRLLGCWRGIALASITRPVERVASAGLALAMTTGVCLLATKATEYAGNPFFWWMKLPAIALGLANIAVLRRSRPWREHAARPLTAQEERRLQWHGGVSLVSWLAAVAGGRMTAYW